MHAGMHALRVVIGQAADFGWRFGRVVRVRLQATQNLLVQPKSAGNFSIRKTSHHLHDPNQNFRVAVAKQRDWL
jgi:hypothetical protein